MSIASRTFNLSIASRTVNLSIASRTFPNACKVVKIKPIFNKGKKTDPSNYRPIFLLPLISKVLEMVNYETKQMHSLKETIYDIITNLDSELIIQLTYASHF